MVQNGYEIMNERSFVLCSFFFYISVEGVSYYQRFND